MRYPEGNRRGFTLIEVLVVITIIGLLILLLLPAIWAARETARRIKCINNLKQFGVGINQYIAVSGLFPPGNSGRTQFSVHALILPHIEQLQVYNQINFNNISILESFGNTTVGRAGISMFQCPSDSYCSSPVSGDAISPNNTNYAGNVGDERMIVQPNGIIGFKPVSPQSATDGLSNSTAMAEMLVSRKKTEERLRTFYKASVINWGPVYSLEIYTARCRDLVFFTPNFGMNKGEIWLFGQRVQTLYNHVMTPNQPSCSFMNSRVSNLGNSITSTSQHPGGVNTLFADGHVQFIKESVSPQVWRAIGTRNGGEVISMTDY